MERKIREYEINIHSLKSGLNKLKIKYEQNKKQIQSLEQETNNLIAKYKKKEDELQIVNNKIKEYKNININVNNKGNNLSIKNKNIYRNKINNNLKTESEESLKNEKIIEENKNLYNKRNNKTLISGGPSLISLTKEKSNFGDYNDIQLINPIENKDDNDSKGKRRKR